MDKSQLGDETFVNICAPNMETLKYTKQLIRKIKKVISSNTIIVWDINIPFISMDKSPKQKINKEIVALNDTLDQMDLIDTFTNSILKQQNAHS